MSTVELYARAVEAKYQVKFKRGNIGSPGNNTSRTMAMYVAYLLSGETLQAVGDAFCCRRENAYYSIKRSKGYLSTNDEAAINIYKSLLELWITCLRAHLKPRMF